MKETLYIQPNGTEDDQDLERSFLLPELGDDMFFYTPLKAGFQRNHQKNCALKLQKLDDTSTNRR